MQSRENTKFSIIIMTDEDLELVNFIHFHQMRQNNSNSDFLPAIKESIKQGKYDWLDIVSNNDEEARKEYDNVSKNIAFHGHPILIEYSENEQGEAVLVSYHILDFKNNEIAQLDRDDDVKLVRKPLRSSSKYDENLCAQKKEPVENKPLFGENQRKKLEHLSQEQYHSNATDDDYVAEVEVGKAKIGACEIQGRRKNQEDRFIASTGDQHELMQALLSSNSGQAESVLLRTFAELQSQYGNYPETGSTCCFAMAKRSHHTDNTDHVTVTCANLGDSAAYLVRIKKDGTVTTQQLTTVHQPNVAAETERLNTIPLSLIYQNMCGVKVVGKIPAFITGNRLLTGLAVSRSLGDTKSETVGLSHQPEIVVTEFAVAKDELVFFLIACDGAWENVDDPANFINQVMEKYKDNYDSPSLLAEQLVRHAYEGINDHHIPSQDNITVGVAQVIPEQMISMAVFDGHGGSEVSAECAAHFYDVFFKNLQLTQECTEEKEKETNIKSATPDNSDDEEKEINNSTPENGDEKKFEKENDEQQRRSMSRLPDNDSENNTPEYDTAEEILSNTTSCLSDTKGEIEELEAQLANAQKQEKKLSFYDRHAGLIFGVFAGMYVGTFVGATVGGTCGFLIGTFASPFTFGLSIPLCTAIGAGIGGIGGGSISVVASSVIGTLQDEEEMQIPIITLQSRLNEAKEKIKQQNQTPQRLETISEEDDLSDSEDEYNQTTNKKNKSCFTSCGAWFNSLWRNTRHHSPHRSGDSKPLLKNRLRK